MNLKVGITGLRRGASYIDCFEAQKNVFPAGNSSGIYVTALCDTDEELLRKFAEKKNVRIFTNYEEFLKSDIDIVVVAVPLPLHANFSILALEAGKHVLSEVPPVNSIEEAKRLVEAVKKTKKKYMLAQNTCYWAHIQAWKEMVEKGRIGKIIYAEAEYIHACREFFANEAKDGRTWRLKMPPLHYCTHSLGPLLSIMKDRCILAQGFQTEEDLDIPEFKPTAAKMEVGIFKTEKGAVIKILCGFGMVREPAFHYYSVYGTKGCLETNRVGNEKTFAYFDDIPNLKNMVSIPIAAGYGNIQVEGTHGGTEYFVVKEFVESILQDKPSPIDVYRALSFSLPGICAHQSALNNGGAVKIPTFEKQE